MKKLLLTATIAFAVLTSTESFGQQGFGTNTPDKSAAVDIVSSQRGLLIPRLNLTGTNVAAPVQSPAQSLLVYNNATAGSGATGVTPGFYYWDTNRWVRIVSTTSEKKTVVAAGKNVQVDSATSPDGLTTTYTVGVAEGTQGQVLVTVLNPSTNESESQWVNPSEFINGVNGVTVTPVTNASTGIVTNEVSLGGGLTKATTITTDAASGKTLAVKGLEVLTPATFDPAVQNVVVMGADGILKEVAPKTLMEDVISAGALNAKKISTSGIITLNGAASDVTDAVLKDVALDIANGSIKSDKLSSSDPATGTNAADGAIATADGNGGVKYEEPSAAIGKTLTTDGIINVGADAATATASTLNGAVLTPTYLKIKDNAITAAQIASGAVGTDELANKAVTPEKMLAVNPDGVTTPLTGKVPVSDANGNITYQSIATIAGEDLTTDGKIVIGSAEASSLADAVLVPTFLKIKAGSIGNTELTPGAVTADKMTSKDTAAGTNAAAGLIPTADGNGGVTYKNVAETAGKTLTGSGITVTAGTTAGTGTSLAQSVLADVTLGIADNAITSDKILNGTIKAEDIQAPGSATNTGGTANQVMVTNAAGEVSWVNQTDLPSNTKFADGTNTAVTGDGSITAPFKVNVATASGTTLGVVKEAATNAEVAIAADGTLSVNEGNIQLAGDVTGPLNNTKVAAIQGVAVATTAPLNDQVLTYNGTAWTPATPTSLVKVDNGISKAADGDVILGGILNETTTTITTGGASNTLGIAGLIAPDAESEIVYAQSTGGVLRKAARSLSQSTGTNLAVSAIAGYNDFVQEINITATIASADINITLPAATASNKGQVVNIKIGNTTEPNNYLNIVANGGSTLTYGALPYQGWIVKSNGSEWAIVGRN